MSCNICNKSTRNFSYVVTCSTCQEVFHRDCARITIDRAIQIRTENSFVCKSCETTSKTCSLDLLRSEIADLKNKIKELQLVVESLKQNTPQITTNVREEEFKSAPECTPEILTLSKSDNNQLGEWRTLGEKKVWKSMFLWEEYDNRRNTRKKQERDHRRRSLRARKQRKIKNSKINNFNKFNNTSSSSKINTNNSLNYNDTQNKNENFSHQQRFSPNRSTVRRKIIASSAQTNPTPIPPLMQSFQKGESLNPLSHPLTTHSIESPATPLPNIEPVIIDPLFPPVIKHTIKSIENQGIENNRFTLSRLRNTRLREAIRDYLAYFKDQTYKISVHGKTRASLQVLISSEGLPTDTDRLMLIYLKFHEVYESLTLDQIKDDFKAHKLFLQSERVNYLNISDKNYKEFYQPYLYYSQKKEYSKPENF